MTKRMIVAAGMICLAVGCTKKPEELGGQNSPVSSDKDNKFITTATEANMTEIKTGEMAEKMSPDTAVQDFGKKLVADHEAATKEVEKLDTEHMDLVKNVESKTGNDFDKEFLDKQVKAHKEALKAAEDEQSDGKNQQVKDLAKTMIPMLQDHLTTAESLQAKLEKTGSATTKPAGM
jgi:putative membrane protein